MSESDRTHGYMWKSERRRQDSESNQQRGRDLSQRLSNRRQRDREPGGGYALRSRSRSTDDRRNAAGEEQFGRPGSRGSRRSRPRHESCSSWPRRPHRSSTTSQPFAHETDPVILARRQKQIDYGKNTLCYQEYISAVPKHKRQLFHPRTPVKLRQTSRRRWDSAIKCWRIHLHYWNDPVKLAQLRSRQDSESDGAESESIGSGVTSEPGPRIGLKREPEPPAAAKREPDSPPPSPSLVKREPYSPSRVGRERPEPEPAALKWEPGSSEPVAIKQEPADSEPDYDPSLSWADDVEGLAEELMGVASS